MWDQGVELSYQWLRNSSPIQGAFSRTYFLNPLDAGAQISVEVTGRKTGFTTVTRTSTGTAAAWPAQVQLVAITGAATLGTILRVQTSELIANESLTYQWQRDGQPISGATGSFFEVSSEDVGSSLTVQVQAPTIASLPVAAVSDTIEILSLGGTEVPRLQRELTNFSNTQSATVSGEATASPAVRGWFEQKSIKTFARNASTLTTLQKTVVRTMVEEHDSADKFICTGIRREGGTRAENIMVRLRAKAACDYALELNPELSTWYQSKVTKAPSFVGRVLLVARGVKEPE